MGIVKSMLGRQFNFLLDRMNYQIISTKSQGMRIELNPADGGDDYNWPLYHIDYSSQLAQLERVNTQKLNSADFFWEDAHLRLKDSLLPLHSNHTCLYETIAELSPGSVIEVGCGGGDHLHNLGELFPTIERIGLDRSSEQLLFLQQRSPHLASLVRVFDATLPPSRDMPQADLVYSQAVIMHIHAGNSHLVALSNMFRMAARSVVLMENFKRHPFMNDIRRLHSEGMIDWPEVKLFFRRHEGNPHILIASKDDLPLEPLTDYSVLVDAMDWHEERA